jgi:hypothetical protein
MAWTAGAVTDRKVSSTRLSPSRRRQPGCFSARQPGLFPPQAFFKKKLIFFLKKIF